MKNNFGCLYKEKMKLIVFASNNKKRFVVVPINFKVKLKLLLKNLIKCKRKRNVLLMRCY